MRGRDLLQWGRAHHFMHGAECGKPVSASLTGSHVRFDVPRMTGVEFAVDQRMKQHFRFIAVHSADPEGTAGPRWVSAAFQAARSMARARARRDITVPTG